MYNVVLSPSQKKIFEAASRFAASVDKQLLIDMDEDKIEYPKETIETLGNLNLLGVRFSEDVGGRGLKWQDEVVLIEEIGMLGAALSCASVMPSIVGEAISKFGSSYQKEKYLKPTLQGKLICAEGLTEPRGGSDFFGATTIAKKDGGKWVLNGQKRFIAQSSALLDAARALVHTAAKAVDETNDASLKRRLVSEAKRFSTQSAWEIVNNAMQIMGGIGYTNVYPIERYLRDTRLMMIWTGTNEIMDLVIQHELYKELDKNRILRDVERDAKSSDQLEEKVFE